MRQTKQSSAPGPYVGSCGSSSVSKNPLFSMADTLGLNIGSYSDMISLKNGVIFCLNNNNPGFRSSNNGAVFTLVNIPDSGTILWTYLFYTKNKTLMAFSGSGSYCSRSTDEGASFSPSPIFIASVGAVHSIAQNQSGRILVAQNSGATAYSDDDGLTWTAGSNIGVNSGIVYDDVHNKFVYVGNSGANGYSTDGVVWTNSVLPSYVSTSSPIYGGGKTICFDGSGTLWALSTDGGISWTNKGNSDIISGGWYSGFYSEKCKLYIGFRQSPGSNTMRLSYSLLGWIQGDFNTTGTQILRIRDCPDGDCLYILTSKLLYKVPVN